MIEGKQTTAVIWKRGPGHGAANQNEYAEITGAAVTIMARVEEARNLIVTKDGRQITIRNVVYCTADVRAGDTLTFDGEERPVVDVQPMRDFGGTVRYKKAVTS